MLHRPYSFVPLDRFQDHYQLALSDLQDWLHEQAPVRAWVLCEHQWTTRPNFEKKRHFLMALGPSAEAR